MSVCPLVTPSLLHHHCIWSSSRLTSSWLIPVSSLTDVTLLTEWSLASVSSGTRFPLFHCPLADLHVASWLTCIYGEMNIPNSGPLYGHTHTYLGICILIANLQPYIHTHTHPHLHTYTHTCFHIELSLCIVSQNIS